MWERAMSIQCDSWRETVPGFDTIHFGSMEAGYRDLCSRCFNQEVAKLGGLNFEHVAFEPVDMRDAVGGAHWFHFRVHLLGEKDAEFGLVINDSLVCRR